MAGLSSQELDRRSAKVYAAGRTLAWLAPAPFAALLIPPGYWRVPIGLGVLLGYLWAAWRGWRVQFNANRDGVRIVNQWRSYEFTWGDVQRVDVVGGRFSTVAFVLRDGAVRRVQATSYSSGLRRTGWAIAKTFAPPTVDVEQNPKL